MSIPLAGKVALVTGGSHGIGLATACALARAGARVAICARNAERLAAAAKLIDAAAVDHVPPTPTLAFPYDALADEDGEDGEDARDVVANVSSLDPVTILVNNVGGGGRWGTDSIETTEPSVWHEVYEKNVGAMIAFTRAVLPGMRASGWGRIVTVSSIHGHEAGARSWFAAAKAAEIAITKSLSRQRDIARSGITVNTVAPGGVMIEGTGTSVERDADSAGFAARIDRLPLGRLVTPDEVAAAIVFLCTPAASGINGACLTVDGGEGSAF